MLSKLRGKLVGTTATVGATLGDGKRKISEWSREVSLFFSVFLALLFYAFIHFQWASSLFFTYFPMPAPSKTDPKTLDLQKYVVGVFIDGSMGLITGISMMLSRFYWRQHSITTKSSELHAGTYQEVANAFVPAWSRISAYDSFRKRLSDLATTIADAMEGDPPEQQLIVESLLGGLLLRFKNHASEFHEIGAVMEEDERSDLTRLLIERSKSYILILNSHGPIDTGAMRWNDGYKTSVQAEVQRKDFATHATLCVVVFEEEGQEKDKTINSVKALGMSCRAIKWSAIEGNLSHSQSTEFKNHGPLIELFGNEIGPCIVDGDKRTLRKGATFAWKSTSFCKKEEHGLPTPLTRDQSIQLVQSRNLTPDGVWLNRVISKRVRASSEHVVGGTDASLMERVLNVIVQDSKHA